MAPPPVIRLHPDDNVVIARATLLPPIDTRGRTRHEVARAARQAISLSLGLDTAGTPPGTETDYQGELL